MRRIFAMLIAVLMIFVGCSKEQQEETVKSYENEYTFLGLSWGDDWETIQKTDMFKDAKAEVKDEATALTAMIYGVEYLEKTVDVALRFGKDEYTTGLHAVYVTYQDEDEETLQAKMTEQYGEMKEYYIDENGELYYVLSKPCWFTAETLKTELSKKEQEKLVEPYKEKYDERRIANMLGVPAVKIYLGDEIYYDDKLLKRIVFDGTRAAIIRSAKK